MEYRKLGRSGVLVSPLCLGAMNFGGSTSEADSFAIMQRAVEGGINFFDTANVYNQGESERITGKFLKDHNVREQVVLATKVFSRVGERPNEAGATRYHIVKACEDSLRRLQTDRIDLYQLHRPPLTHPQEETLRAFDDLIHAGKVLYIGASTHPAWMVMEALAGSKMSSFLSLRDMTWPSCRGRRWRWVCWPVVILKLGSIRKIHALIAGIATWSRPASHNEGSRWARLLAGWQRNVA
jgi:aryl-alcohol dehydrogenase-like predicted oxidoreductase